DGQRRRDGRAHNPDQRCRHACLPFFRVSLCGAHCATQDTRDNPRPPCVNANPAGSGLPRPEGGTMSTSFLLEQDVMRSLHEVAQQLRVDSVRCSATASSGHPTSSMSAADLMAVLLARHLRYDFAEPKAPGNDHLIFSKGHASPLYY